MAKLDFSRLHILVIGDAMLDNYIIGQVFRISPEAPVPIVNVKQNQYSLGGAANVCNNIAHLGASTTLLGISGKDENNKILGKLLKKNSINNALIETEIPTTTKARIIGEHQQIARLDYEKISFISEEVVGKLKERALLLLKKSDAVIISDYGKGVCCEEICQSIIQTGRDLNIPVLIDPKGKEWNKYKGAFLVSPNLKELGEIASKHVANEDSQIEKHGMEVLKRYSFKYLLVTRSEKGMSLISNKEKEYYHIPTDAREVYDVSGAGDTAIATLSLGIASGLKILDAVKLANRAAGIVVGKFGTVPIEKGELEESFYLKEERKIKSLPHLLSVVKALKAQGKIIVFTNGCFDILHTGHITYLRQAKELGDILIVGLNTDNSVKRLKGEKRPIFNEKDRAKMLSSLEVVDYIVLFDEDTPKNIIKKIKPDILVKGGDYKVEKVIGREFASRTIVLPYINGYSTTEIIKRIKESS